MRDDATAYLAVPNRWMLVEPHFKLAFLLTRYDKV